MPEPVLVARTVEALVKTLRAARRARRAWRFSVDHRAGHARTHRDRCAAPGADPEEPALERAQVHRARRGRAARRSRAGADRVAFAVRDTGIGIADAPAGAHLRGVPPGRRQHAPQVRRHRPRPVDLARPGAAARRRPHRAEHAGRGQHLHADAAARLRGRRSEPAPRRLPRRRRVHRVQASAGLADPGAAGEQPPRRRSAPSRSTTTATSSPTGRGVILVIEDDVPLRRDPARPGARAGLPVRRRRTRPTTAWRRPLQLPAERDPARHEPARPLRAWACSTSSSATRARATSRCTSSRSPTTRTRRSSCGAVGYALKPVKREQLVEAFQQLEAKLSQGMRRVLVVEDDARQRESIRQLLANARRGDHRRGDRRARRSRELQRAHLRLHGAWTSTCRTSAATSCSSRWPSRTTCAFPPVIVYTGRSLTRDEEQRLRRFSQSIIIKDARSPERLLDEVTLFLHQVESDLPAERQRMLQSRARPRGGARGPPHPGGRRRRAQHLRAVERARAARAPRWRSPATAARRSRRSSAARSTERQRGRPRADGHHDAGDGRPDRDARDPQAARVEEAADHRAHRQGDEATTRRSASPPAPTTTSPSRSTSRSCCRWSASGCRSERAGREPTAERLRHRAAAAARGDLPAVSLRLPRLRAGLAEAPAAHGDGRASAARRCRSCRTACCTSRRCSRSCSTS